MGETKTKVCPVCREDKPLTDYHISKTRKTGRQSRCKVCESRSMRNYCKTQLAPNGITYGVYSISLNKWIYVGYTSYKLEYRKRMHINQARSKARCAIHQAIRTLGSHDLEWIVLDSSGDPTKEQYYIKRLKTYECGYNSTPTGLAHKGELSNA